MRRALLFGWDALAWVFALSVATGLRDDFDFTEVATRPLQALIAVAVAGQLVGGVVLRTYHGRHPVGSVDEAINVTVATGLAGATAFAASLLFHPELGFRSVPLLAVPFAVLVAVGSRVAVGRHRERRDRADYSRAQRVIVLGAGTEGQQLLRAMLSDPDGRYLPVAFLDDDQKRQRLQASGVPVRGTYADVALTAARSRADMLVIADRSLSISAVREIATTAHDAGLAVSLLASLDELLKPLPGALAVPLPRPPAGDEVIEAAAAARHPALSRGKRALDVVVAAVVALLVLPLLVLIAIALRATAGEVIYRAPRIGRDGRVFTMFKFVTMSRGDGGPRITIQGDLRITAIGRWLRRTKLNELPQILNVLKGDMSLVGPRPEDPRYTSHYAARHRPVLTARPGMTSLAFLRFGDEEAFIARAGPHDLETFYLQELLPQKLDIELDYVTTWSLGQDFRILAATVQKLIR